MRLIQLSALLFAAAVGSFAAEPIAVAVLAPTAGNTVAGTITFTPVEGGLHGQGRIEGLGANSVHAIHIHEFGDPRSADGTAAGGHFNPEGHHHGAPGAQAHAGDLGNLTADASGVAQLDITLSGLSLSDGPKAIAGRSVVIHAKADDLTSQPAGNAGPRIAVGVIGLAAAPK